MKTDDLAAALGVEQVDAVLSTTALHWLPAENLVLLYRQLGQLVRPGGVFLNGDHIKFGSSLKSLQYVADNLKQKQQHAAFEQNGIENWERWWAALANEPEAKALLAERERRFPRKPKEIQAPIVELHEAALRDAGFSEVGVIWQNFDDRVLMAVK
jgi:SAM-dependent methyltransferase